ncbi:Copper transport protein ATOX1 [Trichinella sp. T8]|nr:Copper transport protein ATOX1 [Trichinella sp. T8]
MPSCDVKHGGSVLSGAIKEVTSACLNYLNMRHSFKTDSSENALATTLTVISLLSLPINSECRNWQLHSFEMEMTCSGCAEQVKRVLNRLDDSGKIKNIFFEMNQNKVTVHSSLSKDVLLTALQKTGKNLKLCDISFETIRHILKKISMFQDFLFGLQNIVKLKAQGILYMTVHDEPTSRPLVSVNSDGTSFLFLRSVPTIVVFWLTDLPLHSASMLVGLPQQSNNVPIANNSSKG